VNKGTVYGGTQESKSVTVSLFYWTGLLFFTSSFPIIF
jgi:hypothetical protein